MKQNREKIRLFGFNNLTKTLSFNIYDISYACNKAEIKEYINYVDEKYNSESLTKILTNVANIIGAKILNIAKADYEPIGASVNLLISEEAIEPNEINKDQNINSSPKTIVAHLNKSHITVHTYPETHPDKGVCSFRVDIDVSTCGEISPIKALNFLINSFVSDIVIIDYRVRGFTRDTTGKKHFIDHKLNSIQNFIDQDTLMKYKTLDVNLYQENIFHTKMMLKNFELNNHLFQLKTENLPLTEKEKIENFIRKEIEEIFNGRY